MVFRPGHRHGPEVLAKLRKRRKPLCPTCNERPKAGRDAYCVQCGRARRRRLDLERVYGLTTEGYDKLLEDSGGQCAICGKAAELVVDHDHVSGKVRGLLCRKCNVAIGSLGDSPETLRRAFAYLLGDTPRRPAVDQHHLLVALLIRKGIITEQEYKDCVIKIMRQEIAQSQPAVTNGIKEP